MNGILLLKLLYDGDEFTVEKNGGKVLCISVFQRFCKFTLQSYWDRMRGRGYHVRNSIVIVDIPVLKFPNIVQILTRISRKLAKENAD